MKALKLSILTLALATGGSAVAGTLPVELAAQASNVRLQLAINGTDNNNLKELYTRDAVVIPPSGEIFSNMSDYSTFLADYIRNRVANFQVETINLRTIGDTAYQDAVWMATLKRENGKDTEVSGEMTNVLQRQPDGSWKIKFQNWN
jgi:ketosteroid isomerase-like protein